MRSKFLILICFLFLFAGCKPAVTFKDKNENVKKDFGANVADVKLELNWNVIGLKASSQRGQYQVSSYDILKLSEYMLLSQTQKIKDKGYLISDIFSQPGITATSMSSEVLPPGSPYTEQAYLYLKPVLIGQYTSVLDLAQQKIIEAANALNLKDPQDVSLSAAYYLSQIIYYLSEFNKKLAQYSDPLLSRFLNPVIDEINSAYIKPLSEIIPKLTWQSNQRLDLFLEALKKEMVRMPGLTDGERAAIGHQLLEAIDYSKQLENMQNTDHAIEFIADLWLNKSNRQHSNPEISYLLRSFTEKQLLALSTENKAQYDATSWKILKARKDFDNLTIKELVAVASSNSVLLSEEEWVKLNPDKMKKMITSCQSCINIWGQAETPKEKIQALTAYWFNYRVRFKTFPESLVSGLADYDESEIEYLRNNSTAWLAVTSPKSAYIRYQLTEYIESYQDAKGVKADKKEEGLKNFKLVSIRRIYETVDKNFQERIQGLFANLKEILKKEIIARLEMQKEKFAPMAFENFKEYAKKYLGLWFFSKTKEISLFEPASLSYSKLYGWSKETSGFESSSEVVGAGLSNDYVRLVNSRSEDESRIFAFKIVSKLAALAGYRDYNSQLVEALTLSLTPGFDDRRFDVKKIKEYNPKESLFAVPDRIFIKDNFKAEGERSRSQAEVSVLGQMELLSAYVKIMKYLKPWQATDFNKVLGSLRIDLFPDKEVFAKQELFKQSLVLALTVMYNLRDKMVGVINSKNQFVEGLQATDKVAAVVFGFNREKSVHKVTAEEIANAILTLCEFYDAVSDIKNVKDSDIDTKAIETIESAREQVKTLVLGLSLFTSGKMMEKDGSFPESVDFSNRRYSTKNKRLYDQLIMQKALLRAADLLNLDFFRFRVFDNYFYLNNQMWNSKTGFYRDSLLLSPQVVYLKNVLLITENLKKMLPFLNQYVENNPVLKTSSDQMNKLLDYWRTRHLSDVTVNQTPVELILSQEAIQRR